MARKTGQDGLVEPDQEMERPDLAAVGVPGDLEVDPGLGGLLDLLRLVGEQDDRSARGDTVERGGEIGSVAGQAGRGAGRVVDAA